MGLRSPFGYVSYLKSFTYTFCDLLGGYCNNCHTDTDFIEGCKGCPLGQLLYAMRRYILGAYESDILEKEAKATREVKKVIKKIEPHPGWGWGVLSQSKESIAERALLKELKRLQKRL